MNIAEQILKTELEIRSHLGGNKVMVQIGDLWHRLHSWNSGNHTVNVLVSKGPDTSELKTFETTDVRSVRSTPCEES